MATSAAMSRKRRKEAVWDITFQGLYMSKNADQVTEEKYEIEVVMGQEQVELGATSQFCKHFAPKLMPEKYPTYAGLMTFEIKQAVCSEEELQLNTIALMTFEGLQAYITDQELPIKAEVYEDAGELRQAILQCEADEQTYLANEAILEKKRGTRGKEKISASRFIEESMKRIKPGATVDSLDGV